MAKKRRRVVANGVALPAAIYCGFSAMLASTRFGPQGMKW